MVTNDKILAKLSEGVSIRKTAESLSCVVHQLYSVLCINSLLNEVGFLYNFRKIKIIKIKCCFLSKIV